MKTKGKGQADNSTQRYAGIRGDRAALQMYAQMM